LNAPDTSVGHQLAWVRELTETGRSIGRTEIEEHFAPSYLTQHTHTHVQDLFRDITACGGLRLDPPEYVYRTFWRGFGSCGERRLYVGAQIERDEPHRLTALNLQAAPNFIEVFASMRGTNASVADVVSENVARLAEEITWGGFVIGVVGRDTQTVFCFGDVAADDVFEIGSVTKTFTATLLADLVARGEVSLTDPVSRYLPDGLSLPKDSSGREIRFVDLATHSSGLPHLPPDLKPAEPSDPYADFSLDNLYATLQRIVIHAIGSTVRYSNLGFALLGHTLALATGTPFAGLVRDRICRPLGMTESAIDLDDDLVERTAAGHGMAGNPMPLMKRPVFAPSGGMKSTISDILRYMRANLDPSPTPLTNSITATQRPRVQVGRLTHYGLAWRITIMPNGDRLIWHNGQSGGFSASVVLHPATQTGVALLTNTTSHRLDHCFRIVGALTNEPSATGQA